MARRREAVKHPALLAQMDAKGISQDIAQRYSAGLATVPGWDTLSPNQKNFLLCLPWASTRTDAAKLIGKDYLWYDRQQRKHPNFRAACNTVQEMWATVIQSYNANLVGLALHKMFDALMATDISHRDRLEYIKHIFRVAGFDNPDAQNVNARTYVNRPQITMFNTGQQRQEPPQIVEGET